MNLLNLKSDAMNIENLKSMINVRKTKKDKGLPKLLQELRDMLNKVKKSKLIFKEHPSKMECIKEKQRVLEVHRQ